VEYVADSVTGLVEYVADSGIGLVEYVADSGTALTCCPLSSSFHQRSTFTDLQYPQRRTGAL